MQILRPGDPSTGVSLKKKQERTMSGILVTGGAGFIGSHFIRTLIQERNDIIVNLDALTYAGNRANNSDVEKNKKYIFVHGDINDRQKLKELFDTYEITAVVNFAAESHVDRSIEDPSVFLETNILGTQALMDVAKEAWQIETGTYKEGTRFLQISTDEVYGSLQEGKFTEESPIQPNSPYSASKAAADLLALSYYKTYGFPVVVTRCGNNFGTHQHPEKLIPLMVKQAMLNKQLPVYGDGMQVRDWIHVKDHCRAIALVLKKGTLSQVYNIGGNNEVTNMKIVKTILKITKRPETLISHVQDRLGHDRRYAVDHTKLTKELNWEPKADFSEELEVAIQWYMKK
jgi:dTDP-glucose 4,6-dehydratase